MYERVMPIYFPRTEEEEAYSAAHLPEDIGAWRAARGGAPGPGPSCAHPTDSGPLHRQRKRRALCVRATDSYRHHPVLAQL